MLDLSYRFQSETLSTIFWCKIFDWHFLSHKLLKSTSFQLQPLVQSSAWSQMFSLSSTLILNIGRSSFKVHQTDPERSEVIPLCSLKSSSECFKCQNSDTRLKIKTDWHDDVLLLCGEILDKTRRVLIVAMKHSSSKPSLNHPRRLNKGSSRDMFSLATGLKTRLASQKRFKFPSECQILKS